MKFKCAKEQSIVPAFIETVFEPPDRGCEYEFVKETTRGCPTECVVENDLLCAGTSSVNGRGVMEWGGVEWTGSSMICVMRSQYRNVM